MVVRPAMWSGIGHGNESIHRSGDGGLTPRTLSRMWAQPMVGRSGPNFLITFGCGSRRRDRRAGDDRPLSTGGGRFTLEASVVTNTRRGP